MGFSGPLAVSRQLMIDSQDIAKLISDSAYCAQMGYAQETLPSLFMINKIIIKKLQDINIKKRIDTVIVSFLFL